MYLSLSYTEAEGSQVNILLLDSKRVDSIIFFQGNPIKALKTKMSKDHPQRQEMHCGPRLRGLSDSA